MSEEVLSKEEIDALLKGVGSGQVKTHSPVAPGEVHPFDFTAQNWVGREPMRGLEMVNERLVRLLKTSLANLIRRSPEISVRAMEVIKFGDYTPTLSIPSSLNIMRVKPLRGHALLMFEAQLVFALVDIFFGGDGRFQGKIEEREFTPAELRVIQLLREQMLHDLTEAWSPLQRLEFECVGSDSNPRVITLAPAHDNVVISRIHIDLENSGGDIHLTFPYAMLEPLREVIEVGPQSGNREHDERWTIALREQLKDAEVEISSTLANAHLSVRHLLNLKAGDVIPIGMPKEIDVCVEKVPVFRGEFGIANDRRAIKISSIVPFSSSSTSG